jgi:hypothetical protein
VGSDPAEVTIVTIDEAVGHRHEAAMSPPGCYQTSETYAGSVLNPWQAVNESPPYVVADDLPYIEAFNATLAPESPHRIELDLPPSPIHGFHDSPVVILEANPLWSPGAVEAYGNPAWVRIALDELHTAQGSRFHALEDAWAGNQGGRWWRDCLAGVHRAGYSYESLATKVLSVDFHGYFSKKWTGLPVTLPSQHFGFSLVRSAMDRGATVVLMRAARHWKVAVPGLATYPKLVPARNPRKSSLSAKNLGESGFEHVLQALGSA